MDKKLNKAWDDIKPDEMARDRMLKNILSNEENIQKRKRQKYVNVISAMGIIIAACLCIVIYTFNMEQYSPEVKPSEKFVDTSIQDKDGAKTNKGTKGFGEAKGIENEGGDYKGNDYIDGGMSVNNEVELIINSYNEYGNLEYEIINDRKYSVYIKQYFILEHFNALSNEWIKIEPKEEICVDNITYEIPAGFYHEFEIDLRRYYDLKTDEDYRLSKEIEYNDDKEIISAIFNISDYKK